MSCTDINLWVRENRSRSWDLMNRKKNLRDKTGNSSHLVKSSHLMRQTSLQVKRGVCVKSSYQVKRNSFSGLDKISLNGE